MRRTTLPAFAIYQLAFAVLLLAACVAPVAPGPTGPGQIADAEPPAVLDVFAAASLSEALDALGAGFAATHPGVQLNPNLAGSQQLARQLAEGAPADNFASADMRQMQAAVESGRVLSETVQVFAHNRLVVVYPEDNPAQIDDLGDLAQPGLKLVIAAETVPVGRYTLDFLARASAAPTYTAAFSASVLSNVVSFEENVRSVLNKVALGEADAGIVYTSDTHAAQGISTLAIPDDLNVIATYPIAPLADAHLPELAQEFVAYVLSAEGQEILAGYGFDPVSESPE